jgi:cardiolipin synthase
MRNSAERLMPPSTKHRNTAIEEQEHPYKDRFLTIPNIICFLRVLGSLCLIWVAAAGYARVFVISFVALSLSDWIDGKLARWLNQRSDFGARLDSASDSILYACLLVGSLILKWDVLQHEVVWIGVGLASYGLTTGYGLWKYGRIPSYHTYGAKTTQWLVLIGAVSMLLDISVWPLRVAVVAGTLTNLEATAMTYYLPAWTADVLSVWHVKEAMNRDPQPESADSGE